MATLCAACAGPVWKPKCTELHHFSLEIFGTRFYKTEKHFLILLLVMLSRRTRYRNSKSDCGATFGSEPCAMLDTSIISSSTFVSVASLTIFTRWRPNLRKGPVEQRRPRQGP